METIRNYLDNMFASLPKTARVTEIKNNILENMEEKYNELKQQGKSENEAIGIVISEFGNIAELTSELGLSTDNVEKPLPMVNRDEVEDYLRVKKTTGVQVGIGVFLCILSPAFLILISTLHDAGIWLTGMSDYATGLLGLIVLFVLIATAVGLFIFTGMNFERYKYIEVGVQVPENIAADLKQRYDRYSPTFYVTIIVGVGLIILSPISVLVSNLYGGIANEIGVVILLLLVAGAVFLFITSGTIRESYQRLLKLGNYICSEKQKKEGKVIGAVAAFVWPLAAAIFLFLTIVYGYLNAWLIFPITGILFGIFCSVYSIITKKSK